MGQLDSYRHDPADKTKYYTIVDDWDADANWQAERTVVVSGYLGQPNVPPTRPGYWRLFRTLNLDEYIEFCEDDVIHVEEQPWAVRDNPVEPSKTGKRLVPIMIWLRETARVRPIRVHDFLVGEIANKYMPEADLAARLGEERKLQAGAEPAAGSFAGCTTPAGCGGCINNTK